MKLNQLFKFSASALIAMQLICAPCLSAIPDRDRHIDLSKIDFAYFSFDFSRGMNIAAVQPIHSLRDWRQEDVAKMIPTDMKSNSSGSQVAAQILDQSISSFFNSESVRNSDFGRTAHTVEKKMEQDVVIGGTEEGSIQHVFKFQMRAAQSKAQIAYTGLVNAQVSYHAFQQRSDLELNQDLTDRTKLVYNHIEQPGDRVDVMSLRWTW